MLCTAFGAHAAPAGSAAAAPERVPAEAVAAIMKQQAAYSISATTNSARFQAAVYLGLAQQTLAKDPTGGQVFVHADDWFASFLAASGLDADSAPAFMKLAAEHQQHVLIDCRPGAATNEVKDGPAPDLAINVLLFWHPLTDAGKKAASSFSYRDTLADPEVEVTNYREISLRLLLYGEVIVFDEIIGVRGRPNAGPLGLIFKALGKGLLVHSRQLSFADGRLLMRVKARKWGIVRDVLATVQPDGTMTDGAAADLKVHAPLLKQPFKVIYTPYNWGPLPGAPE
jgi:stage V sporulation protein SpoVS